MQMNRKERDKNWENDRVEENHLQRKNKKKNDTKSK